LSLAPFVGRRAEKPVETLTLLYGQIRSKPTHELHREWKELKAAAVDLRRRYSRAIGLVRDLSPRVAIYEPAGEQPPPARGEDRRQRGFSATALRSLRDTRRHNGIADLEDVDELIRIAEARQTGVATEDDIHILELTHGNPLLQELTPDQLATLAPILRARSDRIVPAYAPVAVAAFAERALLPIPSWTSSNVGGREILLKAFSLLGSFAIRKPPKDANQSFEVTEDQYSAEIYAERDKIVFLGVIFPASGLLRGRVVARRLRDNKTVSDDVSVLVTDLNKIVKSVEL
jgi:hypothetical protein